MELKIQSQEKKALPRQEVISEITFKDVTPSRLEIKSALVKKLKAKEELVIVKKIENAYREQRAVVTTYVYDNEDALNRIEYDYMKSKNTPKKEEKQEEETPAAAPTKEVPVEESGKEAPLEEKPPAAEEREEQPEKKEEGS